MHNYHIVVDHAFVSWFINDVIALGQLDRNTFWVRGEQHEAKFLELGNHIEWVGHEYLNLANRLNKILEPQDKVFVHWYDLPLANFVLNLKPSAVVYNMHWGGELLEEPYLYHAKRNYAARTLKLIQGEADDKIKDTLRLRNFPYVPFFWLYKIRDSIRLQKQFELKRESVLRLQYNVLHPENTGDHRLAQKLYSHRTLVHLPSFYDTNFDLATSSIDSTKPSNAGSLNILLNNAAHYSGNHLDAIALLSKNLDFSQYHFHCPLSYSGSPHQIARIKTYGKEKLKDNFIPITYLMPREEYVSFLNSMDVLFMYQNISQGFGNIIAALTQGKPVFLRKVNSLTEMLTNIGIKVYDADAISDELIATSIEESKAAAEENRIKLMQNFSRETRLQFVKNLLERTN